MRKLNGVINCEKQCISTVKDGAQVIILLVYDYVRDDRSMDGGATDSEDFMSHSKATERVHPFSSESTEDEFVVTITD